MGRTNFQLRPDCPNHFPNGSMRYPAKTAGPIEMQFGMWGGVGDCHHVLDGGPDPTGRGNFRMVRGRPMVKYRDNRA